MALKLPAEFNSLNAKDAHSDNRGQRAGLEFELLYLEDREQSIRFLDDSPAPCIDLV